MHSLANCVTHHRAICYADSSTQCVTNPHSHCSHCDPISSAFCNPNRVTNGSAFGGTNSVAHCIAHCGTDACSDSNPNSVTNSGA